MNWTELLKDEIRVTYTAADKLIGRVEDSALDWKPGEGQNWMTTGQLLRHMTEACGYYCRCFATGDWTSPEGVQAPEGEMFPTAESLPSVASVAAAREALAADKALVLQLIEDLGEEVLSTHKVAAPWSPNEKRELGHQFLGMVMHLEMHKNQLFYYLKMQGQPVNTLHMFGMA
jgi:hypothetical protein